MALTFSPRTWISETLTAALMNTHNRDEHVALAHAAPRWVPALSVGGQASATPTNIGDYTARVQSSTAGTGNFYFSAHVHQLYQGYDKAVVIVISAETGDLRWNVTTDFGADGESRTANSDSIASTTTAVTADQLKAIDISAALTGLAANDYLGLAFNREAADAADTITTLYVLGLLLE